jgi:hypothetical protein
MSVVWSSWNIWMWTLWPNSSSLLDMSSTTKWFLPPRMTTTQRDWITTPAEWLVIHNTTTKELNIYNGTSWSAIWWCSWRIRRLFTIAGSIWATWTNVANTRIIDWTYTISQVNMWLWTAWAWTLTVDINKNWTTIFATTKPTITTTNQSSINTWTLTTTSLASWDILTLDIDWVQTTTKWVDLYVEIIYS